MKKSYLNIGMAALLSSSLFFSSCIGSFNLTNKVLDWNKGIGDKFINELVFVALHIVPVYEISIIADILVLNSVEFWTGDNPVSKAGETKEIETENGKFLVKTTETGYEISNVEMNETVELVFNEAEKSWTAVNGENSVKILEFTSDNTALVYCGDNQTTEVELSQAGVLALKKAVNSFNYALK